MTDSKRLWVVNASPVISLANIGYANILIEACNHLVIPQAVEAEMLAGPDNDLAKQWIMSIGKEYVQDIGTVLPLITGWDLGAGESEVLTWSYQHPSYQAVLDDFAARKFAQVFEISLCGTIGVIVQAKKLGLVSNIKPLLNELIKMDFRVDQNLYNTALQMAGEKL